MKTISLISKSLCWLSVVLCLGRVPVVLAADAPAGGATNAAGRRAPDWLRAGVMYEIFPRNFSASGDFSGITARLDELKDLGVDILWLMPIHPTGEKLKKGSLGSPYSVKDFYAVNPAYGTEDDFKRLIAEAHKRGMKVVMDIVAGHTAWDSVMMAHPEYYKKDADGKIHPPYPDWTDVAELDYGNAELRRYMTDMLVHWTKDFGVDGFRCDTAFTVPVDFWEAARAELAKVNPQVAIITDAGAKPVLLSKAFDMDYAGNLYLSVNQVIAGEQPATLIQDSWEHTQEQFGAGALHLHFTDHHNLTRATVRLGMEGALAAQVLMLSLDGVPLFYNGMEAGDATESADPALFEKMPVFWNPGGRPPLRDIYRDVIKLRKQYAALRDGEVVWLKNSAGEEVLSILRKDAKDEFLIVINLSSRRVSGSVDDLAEGFQPVNIAGWPVPVDNHAPDFKLNGYGWLICHRVVGK